MHSITNHCIHEVLIFKYIHGEWKRSVGRGREGREMGTRKGEGGEQGEEGEEGKREGKMGVKKRDRVKYTTLSFPKWEFASDISSPLTVWEWIPVQERSVMRANHCASECPGSRLCRAQHTPCVRNQSSERWPPGHSHKTDSCEFLNTRNSWRS